MESSSGDFHTHSEEGVSRNGSAVLIVVYSCDSDSLRTFLDLYGC
jgi:hypothetical protein